VALKQRAHARKRGPSPSVPGQRGIHGRGGVHVSPLLAVTLGLLFLLPVFFTPGQLVEEFEFTKVSLLVTGALVLAAWWMAAESSRVGAAGPVRWLRALPGRIVAAVRRDRLGAAVALMLLSAAVSTIASVRPPLSLFGAPQSHAGLRTIAALAAIYYASRSLASNPSWFRRVAQAAGAAAAVAAGYSLVQIANLDPLTWQRHSSFEGIVRSGGTVGHANTLSAYLTMCLPLVLWLAARSRSMAARAGWLALSAMSLFIIVAGLSRGAWLGGAAGALVALALALASGRRPTRAWGLAAIAILVVALALPLLTPVRARLLDRVRQLTDLSAATSRTRVELWSAGLRMFTDHPVLGVGLDAFVAAFPPYRTATLTEIEWGGTPAKAHNDAIQILATQGLLGGLAALTLVVLCALAMWRIARRGNPELRAAAIAAGAALAAYAGSSLVEFATVATSALAAALAGWAARAVQMPDVRSAETAGTGPTGHAPAPREGAPVRSIWNLIGGLALAVVLWFLLVGGPLRAETYRAEAMHYPSGSRAREDLFRRAAASAPWDPRYVAGVGRSLFLEALREQDEQTRLDLLARAREALSKSIRIAPENGENRILYATVISGQSVLNPRPNSEQEVRDEFRRAVELDPLNPVVLVGAERGLMGVGLMTEARELAFRCARAYPDYAPPLADLGAIALQEGRTAAAAETLKLAVRRSWREDAAGAANAWNDLASASLALGQYQQAADAADSALARNPKLGQAFALRQAAVQAMSPKGAGQGTAGEKGR